MYVIDYETCKNGYYQKGKIALTDEEYNKILNSNNETNKKGVDNKMSVPAYERTQSQLEMLTKADDLLKCTLINLKKIPKTYTFFGKTETYQDVRKVKKCLVRANNLDLFKYYDEREKLLNESLGWLACVSDDINLLKVIGVKLDKDAKKNANKWVRWGTLITITENLIKGIISKDKERYDKK